VTDKRGSYVKPIQNIAPNAEFKSPRQAQLFLSDHDQINTIFPPCRYNLTAISYRHARSDAFALWLDKIAEMIA